jgi:hypothetical protein
MYERPLGYEIRDLTLTLGDDVAFGHSLNRVSGWGTPPGTTPDR